MVDMVVSISDLEMTILSLTAHWHTLVVYLVTALWWLSRSCTHSSAWLRRLDWCCWLISAAGGKILAWPSREWLVVSKVWTGPEPSPANWCLPAHTWLADGWFKLQLINRWEVREISGIPCPHNTRTVCTKWQGSNLLLHQTPSGEWLQWVQYNAPPRLQLQLNSARSFRNLIFIIAVQHPTYTQFSHFYIHKQNNVTVSIQVAIAERPAKDRFWNICCNKTSLVSTCLSVLKLILFSKEIRSMLWFL